MLKGAGGALLLQIHEHREFFVHRDERFDVVFELEGQPLRFLRLPRSRKFLKGVRIGFDQPAMAPKRRMLLRPKSEQAMIRGDGMNAFPEHWAQVVCEREIGKCLAMNAAVLLRDFESNRADQHALRVFGNLEFSNPLA